LPLRNKSCIEAQKLPERIARIMADLTEPTQQASLLSTQNESRASIDALYIHQRIPAKYSYLLSELCVTSIISIICERSQF
jgi:hypothetical protein